MGKRSHKARSGSTTRRRSHGGGASRPSAEDVLRGLPVVGELENVPSFADMAPTQLRREQLEEARERIADRLGREKVPRGQTQTLHESNSKRAPWCANARSRC